MAVLNDYVCFAHGEFESRTGKCPHGCGGGMTQIKFNKAPSISTSGKAQFIDRKMNDLARQFGDAAMNDKYDSSRIDMSQTDDIQKKRLAGQTYAVPLDPKTGVDGYIGSTVGVDFPVAEIARQAASDGLRETHVAHDDHSALPSE